MWPSQPPPAIGSRTVPWENTLVSADVELLDTLGVTEERWVNPELFARTVQLARKILHYKYKRIGFVPSKHAAVTGVALQIGFTLSELEEGTVAYVDANLRYPALHHRTSSGDAYSTRWLKNQFAYLAPNGARHPGALIPSLNAVLHQGGALFEHMLVDLTGFDEFGEMQTAIDSMDQVIIVARTGRTTEEDLLATRQKLDETKLFGVLLVG